MNTKVEIEATVGTVDLLSYLVMVKRFVQREINEIFIFNSESLSMYAYKVHILLAVIKSCFLLFLFSSIAAIQLCLSRDLDARISWLMD